MRKKKNKTKQKQKPKIDHWRNEWGQNWAMQTTYSAARAHKVEENGDVVNNNDG